MKTLADILSVHSLSLPDTVGALIGGRRIAGDGEAVACFYPATAEPSTTLLGSSGAQVDRAVADARTAFAGWRKTAVARRVELLHAIAAAITKHADELALLQSIETGIPAAHALRTHVERAAENFRFFADVANTQAGQTFTQMDGFLTLTVREPVGVAAVFSPWNAPLVLSSMKVAAALACGNTVVLKPSEFTPLSALRVAELALEAGLPPGVLNVVNGPGHVTGKALAEHPDVGVIGFIGGTATGKAIMAAAAARIAKVGLELGGKSANIVTDSADLPRAVDGALLSIFTGAGQQCLAGSRILVQRSVADRFLEAFVSRAASIRVGDPSDPATEMGPIAHRNHRDRVLAMVERAGVDGAKLLTGGCVVDELAPGYFVAPTVLLVPSNNLTICQEEVFGPVAAVQLFDEVDEAIAIANASRFGLVGYVWSDHLPTAMRIAMGVETGTMWVNTPLVRDLRAPFGGVKESGLGRDGRDACIDLFTEEKTIMLPVDPKPLHRLGVR